MEEEEKKHVPKFSPFFFSFFYFLWDFSLIFCTSRESKKKVTREEKRRASETDATHKKKECVLNRGLEPRTFRLRYQSVSGAYNIRRTL